MARHLVLLAALLAQPQPKPAVLHEDVLDPHGQRRPDPPEGEHHERDQRPVAQPDRRGDVDAVEQRPRLGRIQHRRLALAHAVRRTADGGGGIERHDLADDQPVEQVADGGELLLDRRRGALLGFAPRSRSPRAAAARPAAKSPRGPRTRPESPPQTVRRLGACAGCEWRRRRTRGSAPTRARHRQRPTSATYLASHQRRVGSRERSEQAVKHLVDGAEPLEPVARDDAMVLALELDAVGISLDVLSQLHAGDVWKRLAGLTAEP